MLTTANEIDNSNVHPVSARVAKRPATRPSSALPPFNVTSPPALGDTLAVPIARLVRHPDNRQPTADQVAKMVASLEQHGQLEPLVVRQLPDGHRQRGNGLDGSHVRPGAECWQILSGETRALAQLERGVAHVTCRVFDCDDDARALVLLAEFNAARDDLNPIERARLIDRLCQPKAEGGGGLTRDQAGRIYGFQSSSAASNAVRLLELPDQVQRLVESGQLPETFAREMLPFVVVPAVVAEASAKIAKWTDATRPDRGDFVHDLASIANKKTRSMDAARNVSKWSIDHERDRLFDCDDDTLAKLRVVTVPLWGNRKENRATNWKLWDALQAAAKKTKRVELEKAATRKAGKSAGKETKPRERTAAEQKALAAEQAEQLKKRIARWRHEWLRELIAAKLRAVGPAHWVVSKLVLWCLAHRWDYRAHEQLALDHSLVRICGGKAGAICDLHGGSGRKVAELAAEHCTPATLLELLARAIVAEERNPDFPVWPFDFVDRLAADLEIDLAAAWRDMQPNGRPRAERLKAFFALHQSGQLDQLAKELGVHTAEASGKAAKLRLLDVVPRALPLPACLAAAKPKKRRRA